jgi:predicted dehydrogenase
MARVHSHALRTAPELFSDLPLRPRLVIAADVEEKLARGLAERFGYSRIETDWRAVVQAPDVDLVCVCLPPVLNRDPVIAAASNTKHVFCEKPLADTATNAAEMLKACEAAGITHALGTGFRCAPAMVAIRQLIERGEIGEIRHFHGSYYLDYAASADVPLLWRFRAAVAGGGAAADTGYHLIDCARFLVGEIRAVSALTARFVPQRPLPQTDVWDASTPDGEGELGSVDVEDAAAALVHFTNGAYGVLDTSRVAVGRGNWLQLEVYGSEGSVEWNFEHIDEFRLCRLSDPQETRGFRRVMVNQSHPGRELLIGIGSATGIGWLGQQAMLWSEIIRAVHEGRPASPSFEDGLSDSIALEAIYSSAASGGLVELPATSDRLAAVAGAA